jgi:hypothetical protein
MIPKRIYYDSYLIISSANSHDEQAFQLKAQKIPQTPNHDATSTAHPRDQAVPPSSSDTTPPPKHSSPSTTHKPATNQHATIASPIEQNGF